MVRLREQEAEAELVDRLLDPLGRHRQLEAERLEHVGGARRRRRGAVAVLRHAGARGGRDERGGGRDVPRVRAVAAGAGRVDEVVALRVHAQHVLAHRLGAARRSRPPSRPSAAARRGSRRSAPASPRRAMIVFITPRASSRERSWPSSSCRERRLDHVPLQEVPPEVRARRASAPTPGWNWTPSTAQLAVADGHHLAVGGGRRDLEAVRAPTSPRASGSAPPRTRSAAPRRCPRPSWLTLVALPWTSARACPTSPPNTVDDRLVAEADAEHRHAPRERPHHRLRHARVLGPARARARSRGATARAAPPPRP